MCRSAMRPPPGPSGGSSNGADWRRIQRATAPAGPCSSPAPADLAVPGYGVIRSIMRAKGMVSRTWCRPQIQATQRSTPMPKPACGAEP